MMDPRVGQNGGGDAPLGRIANRQVGPLAIANGEAANEVEQEQDAE